MCRAINCGGGRRCPLSVEQRREVSRRAVRNRKTRTVIAENMRARGWDNAAESLMRMSPNKSSALLLAAEAVMPGAIDELRGGRPMVGLHNMITEDVRDRRSPEGKRLNALKTDPRAIEAIQGALVALDRDIADNTDDPALRRRLERSLDVREHALEAGVFSHVPDGMLSDEAARARREFYVTTPPEQLEALTEGAQRITNQFYESHLATARPVTRQRRPSDELRAAERKHGKFATIAEFMEDGADRRPLGENVDLVRVGRDQYAVRVEGMTLPVDSDLRASDVLRRTPIVEDLGIVKSDSLLGQTLVSKAYLDPASARGLPHVKALKRQIIANSVRAGVTPTSGSSGVLDGKPNWRTTDVVAGLGIQGEYRVAPPSEGLLLGRFMAERDKTLDTLDDKIRERAGIPEGVGTATTWRGNAKPDLGRYSGPVSAADRQDNERAGWMLRSAKTQGQLGSMAEAVPTSAFMSNGPRTRLAAVWEGSSAPGVADGLRDQAHDRDLRRIPPERLVESANRIVRSGKHPDLAGSDAVVSKSVLDRVFKRRDLYRHYEPTASTAFFEAPAGKDTAKWLAETFPVDGAVSTTGYTVTSPPDTAAPPVTGKQTYRVRYLTGDGIAVNDRSTIIGHRSTFRTHHIADEDGMPTVYLVSENAAADAAADAMGATA